MFSFFFCERFCCRQETRLKKQREQKRKRRSEMGFEQKKSLGEKDKLSERKKKE